MRVDVAIIGAGPAGSACARELRRHNFDVAVFERARFPRDKVCGEFVSPAAVQCLDYLGVGPAVRAAGAVEITSAALVFDESVHARVSLAAPALGVSRRSLDRLLADVSGVHQAHSVRSVEHDRFGFRLIVDAPASTVGVRCRIVVDAAGRASRFSPGVPTARYGVQFHSGELLKPELRMTFTRNHYGGTLPVEDGRSNSCFLVNASGLKEFLHRNDALITGQMLYQRKPGPLLAVGDSAGMIDPFSGSGIHHALYAGIAAGRAIAVGLRRGRSYAAIRDDYTCRMRYAWAAPMRTSAILRMVGDTGAGFNAFVSGLRWWPGLAARLTQRLWDASVPW